MTESKKCHQWFSNLATVGAGLNCGYCFKWAILGLFYFYFCLFNTFDSNQMFKINFADDWIWTADLGYWKQLLYQLSHSHCLGRGYLTHTFGSAYSFWWSYYTQKEKLSLYAVCLRRSTTLTYILSPQPWTNLIKKFQSRVITLHKCEVLWQCDQTKIAKCL